MTPVERILTKLPDAKQTGKGWSARCPAHEDRRASLSIGVGDDGRALVKCHAGCSVNAVVAAVHLQICDLMPGDGDETVKPSRKGKDSSPSPASKPRKVHPDRASAYRAALWSMHAKRSSKHWEYHNRDGDCVGMVIRVDQPDGSKLIKPIARVDGGWVVGHMPEPRPLYRLKAVLQANRVIVTEGEKAADAGVRLGLVCTTSAGGANAARMSDWSTLANAESIVLFPDNDPAGETYVHDVLVELARLPQRPNVYVVRLPGLPGGGDLFDWVAERQGQPPSEARAELDALVATATPVDLEQVQANASLPAALGPKGDDEPEALQYVPLPTELLPAQAREFVEAGAKALGCDPAYIALPLLAALASAVGNTRRIKIKGTWCEPCVFWMVIIGESGTLKSPALDLALEYVRRRQGTELREYRDAVREYEQSMPLYEAKLAEWKKKGAKKRQPPPEKPRPPVWRQRMVEDVTAEASAELLQDQPRGILLARDELAGWINSFDAYKSSRGADVAHWLSMHRAGSVLVNRKTGKKLIWAPRAAVSVCGGVQPVTLAAALAGRYSPSGPEQMEKPPSEHFANGFAARLLFASPPRVPKQWTDADLDDAVRRAMQQLFDNLFALEAPVDENGELVPVDLPMTPEAKRLWISFYNAHANEQNGLEGDLAAAWSKGEGYAPRFALLFELIANPNSETIGVASMDAAIEMARWFVDEAARVYADLGRGFDDPEAHEQRELMRVVDWMRSRGGAATVRDLTRGPRRYRGKVEEAEQALRKLEEAGLITKVNGETKKQGGRPTQWYMVTDMSLAEVAPLFQPDDSDDGNLGGKKCNGDENQSLPANEPISSPSPHHNCCESEDNSRRQQKWGEV